MTNIELQVQNLLEDNGFICKPYSQYNKYDPSNIIYSQFSFLNMKLDFALPKSKIAIEVDGNYWHANSKTIKPHQAKKMIEDKNKNTELIKSGWTAIFIEETFLNRKSFPALFYRKILESFLV